MVRFHDIKGGSYLCGKGSTVSSILPDDTDHDTNNKGMCIPL